jgi:cold shock protein
MARIRGEVRWFNNAKGYGFLSRENAPDVFVHYSAVQTEGYKSLKEGEKVEYEVISGEKGLQADSVTRLSQKPALRSAA